MADPRPALRAIATVDRRGAVWCASLCALSVAHLWPSDPRPRRAVVLALAWACGVPVPKERLRDAAEAAYAYASAYAYAYASADASASASASAYAYASADASASASASAYAYAYADADAASWRARRERHLAALGALVEHQTTPIVDVPLVGRPGALVAWDAAAVDLGPVRVGTLGDALARARRHRLRWHVPVERAVAERLADNHPAWRLVGRARG